MPKLVVIDKIISNSSYGPEIDHVLVNPDAISSIEKLTAVAAEPRTLIMVGYTYYVTQRSMEEVVDALRMQVLP